MVGIAIIFLKVLFFVALFLFWVVVAKMLDRFLKKIEK